VYYYNTSSVFAEEPLYNVVEPVAAPEKEPIEPEALQGEGLAGVEDLEEEADQQGAFNPETGEINWDCPCLGGMAHGPCGEEFRAAFSCFIYSTEEPKGMDCIDRFKGMQDCFRAHPDIYGAELEEGEGEGEGEELEGVQDIASPNNAPNPSSEDPDSTPTVFPPIHNESSLTDEVRAKRDDQGCGSEG